MKKAWIGKLTKVALGAGLVWASLVGAAEYAPVRHSPARAQQSEAARVIVQFKGGASVLRSSVQSAGATSTWPQAAATLSQRHGLALRDGRALGTRIQVIQAQGIDSQALADKLLADPEVAWAVVDHRRFAMAAPNDPLYPGNQANATPKVGQWYLRPNSGEVKSSIDVEPAWAITTGSSSVVVAVLDTGITNHPDLNNKVVAGYDFVGYSSDSVATANDGDLDDADPHDPGDWITSAEDASGEFKDCGASDSSWHGTQVSGLVGASTGNGAGMAGIGRGVTVLPVRVLGKCGGYDSDIIAGMRWAAGFAVSGVATNTHPAKVLNLSLGSNGSCTAAYVNVMTELESAGVSVIAAAGNDGLAVGVPANCPNVVAVAGVRHTGTKVGYSNLGPEVVVSAPAGNCVNETGACLYPILTTVNTGTTGPAAASYSDSYLATLGTSFSTPIVAGTVGLMLSADPALTPATVRSLLKSTARPFPTAGADVGVSNCLAPSDVAQDAECYCTTTTCGAGLLDAGAAVAAAATAANGLVAQISPNPGYPVAGDSLALDAAGSSVGGGRTITGYQWDITEGAGLASFTSGTNAATATLRTSGAGTVTVRLTLTDSGGHHASSSTRLTVAASSLAAAITATPTAPEVGDSVSLSASSSKVDAGRTVTAYQWEITSGGTLASFSGATNAATATLATTAAGSVTVRLTITDSAGLQASTTRTLTISAASSGGGGGGGAMAPWWGLGLLLAAWGLGRRRRRAH
ncbi:S8 family serine peptidase [Ideonella sp. DXS29W]|uniref:S8 family serine peptidase n=1 Tax=Ideonella lacteola TaxID=2984193 RepID=A0ABU9BKF6_9BURK